MGTFWNRLRARLRRFYDAELKSLAVNTMWLSGATASKVLLGLLQVAVVTRFLGARGYGQLALVMSVTQFVVVVLSARVWEWVTKYFTDAHTKHDVEEAGASIKLGYLLSAGINVLAILIVGTTSGWVARTILHQPQLGALVAAFSLTLATTWVGETSTAVLRTFGRYPFLAVFGVSTTLLRVACLSVPLILGYGLAGVIAAHIVTEALVNIYLFGTTHREFARQFGRPWWRSSLASLAPRKREIIHMLSYSFSTDTIKSIGSQVDVLVLGYIRPPENVAYYRVALNFVDVINRLASSLIMVAYPSLTRLAAKREYGAVFRLIRKSSAGVAAMLIPGCGLIALLAPWLIRLASGPGYEGAVPVLRVLIWSCLWIIVFWLAATCMSIGRFRWVFEFNAIHFVFRTALLVPFAFYYGEMGVAWTNVISHVGSIGLAYFYLARIRTHVKQLPMTEHAAPT
jgi:O-antigen/teichoic acid export membrane protein